MNRPHYITILLAAIAAFALSACGDKKDAIKRVPEEANVSREAFSAIENLRGAYVSKDDAGMRGATTEAGYSSVRKEMREFDSASLEFTPRWVEIRDSAATVNVQWEGSWTKGGKTTKERGMAVMELTGSPPRVNRIIKGSPFAYPQ
jgi:hypothetical protein